MPGLKLVLIRLHPFLHPWPLMYMCSFTPFYIPGPSCHPFLYFWPILYFLHPWPSCACGPSPLSTSLAPPVTPFFIAGPSCTFYIPGENLESNFKWLSILSWMERWNESLEWKSLILVIIKFLCLYRYSTAELRKLLHYSLIQFDESWFFEF